MVSKISSINFMTVWTVVQQKCITTLGKQDKRYLMRFDTHELLVLQPIEDFNAYEKAVAYIKQFVDCPSPDVKLKNLSIIERQIVI